MNSRARNELIRVVAGLLMIVVGVALFMSKTRVSSDFLEYFDNGSEERIAASKTFIRYITENDTTYTRAVRISSYWPVRDIDDIYENDMLMTEYSTFMPYLGSYYQITPGWSDARTAWWQMLAKIGNGTDISEAVKEFPSPD